MLSEIKVVIFWRLAVARFYLDFLLGVDDVQVGKFSWHHFGVEKLSSFFFVVAVVDFKCIIIVSQDFLEISNKLTHKLFGPHYKQNRLWCLFLAPYFVLELGHVGIENELNVECSFEAGVKHALREFLSLETVELLELLLKVVWEYCFRNRLELISADALVGLQEGHVHVLADLLLKAV